MMQAGEKENENRKQKEKTVQIRPMSPADIPTVAALERQSFSEPWSEHGFEDALLGQQNIFLVAEPEDDRIAGYIGLYGSFDEGDITNVAVDPSFRGRGIGTLLVNAVKEMAVRQGIRNIFLEVRESNGAARTLYSRSGFEPCGRRKDFYREPTEDAILMQISLG